MFFILFYFVLYSLFVLSLFLFSPSPVTTMVTTHGGGHVGVLRPGEGLGALCEG
jgi:hypothetical protein